LRVFGQPKKFNVFLTDVCRLALWANALIDKRDLFERSELALSHILRLPHLIRPDGASLVLGSFASTTRVAPFGTRQATSSAAGPKPGQYFHLLKRILIETEPEHYMDSVILA